MESAPAAALFSDHGQAGTACRGLAGEEGAFSPTGSAETPETALPVWVAVERAEQIHIPGGTGSTAPAAREEGAGTAVPASDLRRLRAGEVDLAFQRDSRRYDNGFTLF